MMGFDDSLPIERYQNPKSKNTVLAMSNVFSATDCKLRSYTTSYVQLPDLTSIQNAVSSIQLTHDSYLQIILHFSL